jgi:CheY-like chemotaxis protein
LNEKPDVSPTSSVRIKRDPIVSRRVWILGSTPKRSGPAEAALQDAGHDVRVAEQGSELAPALREFRPDLIVIDMQEHPDRGRHVAGQLRADRSTRQLPIILVGMGNGEEAMKADKTVTGPTRRYVLPLDAPSVVAAIVAEL